MKFIDSIARDNEYGQDPILIFLNERYDIVKGDYTIKDCSVKAGELYKDFVQWCVDAEEYCVDNKAFSKILIEDIGIKRKVDNKKSRHYVGLRRKRDE
jgi:phage/plasmid-associated DNA primase